MTKQSNYTLNQTITFQHKSVSVLACQLKDVTVTIEDNRFLDVRIVCQMPLSDYQSLLSGGFFHMSHGVIEHMGQLEFDDTFPIEVYLQLDTLAVSDYLDLSASEEWVAEKLIAGQGKLNDQGVWYMTQAMQAIDVPDEFPEGSAKHGTQTIWYGDPVGLVFASAVDFLIGDDWALNRVKEQTKLQFNYAGDNGDFICHFESRERDYLAIVYSYYPTPIPATQRDSISKLISLINYGLPVGNFEMSFDNGQLRYRTSVDVENTQISKAVIRNLVVPNVLTMERYMPAIMACLRGQTPIQAFQLVEG